MQLSETNYAYAVGRIRSLETRLLDQNKLERMIDAPSPDEAMKVLAETDYSAAAAGLTTVHDFETMLQDEMNRTLELLLKICPQPEFIQMMALPFDVHNLKVLFKAKFLDMETELLLPLGTLAPEKVKFMVSEEDFRDFPPLRDAAEEVVEQFAVKQDPQLIDLILEKALFETLLHQAREAGSSFLVGLFRRQVDLNNIKVFIRVKRMEKGRDFLRQVLLPGGLLSVDRFIGLLDEPLESLPLQLEMTDYAELIHEGVQQWQDKGSAVRLEKLSDDYITSYLQAGKGQAFGLEPLIGYLWAKEIEVKNIRLILVGKINKLPAGAIRERLRNVYV